MSANGFDALIEKIQFKGQDLCCIIRAKFKPAKTTFLTPPDFKQQVGFIVYPAGGEIARHAHRALERRLVGTSEVLVVKKGRCEVDIYSDGKELVATRELRVGDVLVLVNGGHGFRMLEDTTFLEIKQGPYVAGDDKERF